MQLRKLSVFLSWEGRTQTVRDCISKLCLARRAVNNEASAEALAPSKASRRKRPKKRMGREGPEPFSLSSSCARAGAAFLLRSWSSPRWVPTSHRKESGLGVEARCPFGNGFSVGARVGMVAACRGRSRRAAGGRRSARGTSRGPMPRADSVNALDRVHGAA